MSRVGVRNCPPSSPKKSSLNGSIRNASQCVSSPSCLCEAFRPILWLSQITGITPVTVEHQTQTSTRGSVNFIGSSNENQLEFPRVKLCKFSAKWCSIPSFLNALFFVHFTVMTFWVMFHVRDYLGGHFKGTDLYTLGLQVGALYVHTDISLLVSMVKRHGLVNIWEQLQSIYIELQFITTTVTLSNKLRKRLQNLRRICSLIVLAIFILVIPYAAVFLILIFGPCKDIEDEESKKLCKGDQFFIIQKVTHVTIVLYKQSTASVFCALCLIMRILYFQIGDILKDSLSTNEFGIQSVTAKQLEKLRILHQRLCKISKHMSSYFGITILAVSCGAVLSITCGIYTFILYEGNLYYGEHLVVNSFYIWGFHGWFSIYVLALILIPGQMVTNAAEKPVQVISEASLHHLDLDVKYQAAVFLQKAGGQQATITAVHVTNIRLSFLAAVATNVTTYILVILQFRLSLDKSAENN